MARYRTYKNGITGHRYKGYYIIRGDAKGKFSIWNEDKTVFKDNILDYEECEWILDKETADETNLNLMQSLYEKEIYQLNEIFWDLLQKKKNKELDPKGEELYKMVEKIRRRKIQDRQF